MSQPEYQITKPASDDFDEWATLFRAYIDFYQSSIPEEQYRKTFDRIIKQQDGLQALVVKQVDGGSTKLVGIAHFFPQQTPWSEKQILLLNGKISIYSSYKSLKYVIPYITSRFVRRSVVAW